MFLLVVIGIVLSLLALGVYILGVGAQEEHHRDSSWFFNKWEDN